MKERGWSLRRVYLSLVGAGCLSAAIGAVGLVRSPAHADNFFSATAIASGVDTSASGTQVPLNASGEVSTPEVQATFDSLGTSRGFAAAPYPGDFAASLPPTAAGVSPVAPPVSSYPAEAASDAGTDPDASLRQPGYDLQSSSTSTGTHATASLGPSSNGSGAGTAKTDAQAGEQGSTAHADATTDVSGLTAGGMLSFGTVHTEAHASVDPSGHLLTSSKVTVSGLEIAGTAVGFADGQLLIAGTSEPLPQNPLLSSLARQGITIAYLGPQHLPDGVESPGIEITMTEPGVANTPASGSYTETFVLGRSIATIEGTPSPADTADTLGSGAGSSGPAFIGSTPSAPSATPAASAAPSTPAGGSTDGQGDVPAAGAAGPSAAGADLNAAPIPSLAGGAPAGSRPNRPSVPGGATAAPRLLATSTPGHLEAVDIYLALAVGGVLVLLSSVLMSRLGTSARLK